jgi:hypothetical protein
MSNQTPTGLKATESRHDGIEVSRTGTALFGIRQKHLREFGGGRQ